MIERVTIDGREGSACFIDSKFKPVAEAKASFYKIVFDDGGQLILEARKRTPPTKARRRMTRRTPTRRPWALDGWRR